MLKNKPFINSWLKISQYAFSQLVLSMSSTEKNETEKTKRALFFCL